MRSLAIVPRAAFVVLVLTLPARADIQSFVTASPFVSIGSSTTAVLPQFDGSLGVLTSIEININALVAGTWKVENTTTSPFTMTSGYIGVSVPVTLPNSGTSGTSIGYLGYGLTAGFPAPLALAAFDGVLDFAGPSAGPVDMSGQPFSSTVSANLVHPSTFAPYLGSGTWTANVTPGSVSGPILFPTELQSSASLQGAARVEVRYSYTAFPAAICRTYLHPACPCAQVFAQNNGGCVNSVSTTGAPLDVSGVGRIGGDTLRLTGSAMPNDGFAAYFQGTTYAYVGTPLGDGLLCIGGGLMRLGVRQSVGGTSQYPGVGDAPISVQGSVTTPGLRAYQAQYRDAASFCTPATFNFTSAFVVRWAP